MWLLAYIPNALAYVFVSLLVCIICFIIIYISHKLYLVINDKFQVVAVGESQVALGKRKHSAVTVVVLFDKCYLVVNAFRPKGEFGVKLLRYTETFDEQFSNERLQELQNEMTDQ